MAYSYKHTPGDGVTTLFTFAFPYIHPDHIGVKVDGVVTAFTWVTDFSISISPAPASGAIVEIRRTTPRDEPLTDFVNAATLAEDDLDISTLQQFYVMQELLDDSTVSIKINALDQFDALSKEIINLTTPDGTDPTAVVNVDYINSVVLGSIVPQASAIAFTPAGDIISTDTQAAVEEVLALSQSKAQVQKANVVADTSVSANAIEVAATPAVTAYTHGLRLGITVGNTVTGATTIDVDTLGTKALISTGGEPMRDGDILEDDYIEVVYDSIADAFRLVSASRKVQDSYKVPVRNTVMSGRVDADNEPDFLVAGVTTGTVDLKATATPLRVTFAHGFDDRGRVDYLANIKADVTAAWTLPDVSTPYYLYIDRNITTGAITYGQVPYLAPIAGNTIDNAEPRCVSLLEFAGSDGATVFPDHGPLYDWVAVGNAQINGNRLLLDGVGDYIAGDKGSVVGPGYDANLGVRIHIRAQPTAISRTNPIFAANGGYNLNITLASDNKLRLYVSSTGSSWNVANAVAGTLVWTAGTEREVELVWDGATYKVYVDGVEDISVTSALPMFRTVDLVRVGADSTSTFQGFLDDVWQEYGATKQEPSPRTGGAVRTTRMSDGEHWFDTSSYTHKVWNHSTEQFDEVQRVFVGKATTDGAGAISDLMVYSFNGQYEIPATYMTLVTFYFLDHKQPYPPQVVRTQLRQGEGFEWSNYAGKMYAYNGYDYGVLTTVNRDQIVVETVDNYIASSSITGQRASSSASTTEGFFRAQIFRGF